MKNLKSHDCAIFFFAGVWLVLALAQGDLGLFLAVLFFMVLFLFLIYGVLN